jgi:alpha-beta hydrolase superfamily lysophospholipase
MSQHPTLVSRCILISPMLRSRCGIKSLSYSFSLPQPIARWIAMSASWATLGHQNVFGYFNEKPSDVTKRFVWTSDEEQILIWQSLKQRYPEILSTCLTYDWLYESIQMQRNFARRYNFVRTNTLILGADHDRFVYNRAMKHFIKNASSAKLYILENACHDLLHETEAIRSQIHSIILQYFTQKADNVMLLDDSQFSASVVSIEKNSPVYSLTETGFRGFGFVVGGVGICVGLAMIFLPSRRK